MREELTTIATYQYPSDAELARMHLKEQGIRAFLADVETVATNWLLGGAIGNVKLQVHVSRAGRATAILAASPDAPVAERSDRLDADDAWLCLKCHAEAPNDRTSCPSCGWSFEEAWRDDSI